MKAHHHFSDPEWDGEPLDPEDCPSCGQRPCVCERPEAEPCPDCGKRPCECPKEPCEVCGQLKCVCEKKRKIKVKLADGKARNIQHMMMTSFWHPDGTPMSSQQFMEMLFGKLPEFFHDETELRTLFRSNVKIPEIFLRGCGLPDEFITYIPSFVLNAFDFYSCVISYNHEDKQFARQLHDRLQGKGIRCWLDEKQLKPGDNIYKDVDRGIRVWDKVLLCCSDNSLKSWWVNREITTAIEKEREFYQQHGEEIWKIIPLNLDGSLFKWTGEHGAVIRQRLAPDFTNWKSDADKFDSQLGEVVKALRTDGGKLPEPTPKLPKVTK